MRLALVSSLLVLTLPSFSVAPQSVVGTWTGRPDIDFEKEEAALNKAAKTIAPKLVMYRLQMLRQTKSFVVTLVLAEDKTMLMTSKTAMGGTRPLRGTWVLSGQELSLKFGNTAFPGSNKPIKFKLSKDGKSLTDGDSKGNLPSKLVKESSR